MTDVMRLNYRALSESEQAEIRAIKEKAKELYDLIGSADCTSNGSRELSLAKTKVEEAVMWATKHIAAPLVTSETEAA
jgi:hypothetical protein